ncbi:MAG: flagellar hook capping FlgD N-terminal domain-containing protein [Comamonadaceae bacterium]
MTNLNLLSSNNMTSANTSWAAAVPSSIKTTASAAEAALTAKTGTASGMGQKDFLTLFTTQLNNQDPLDPVKNEAFVAQLAQFSQLEATTNMSQTLTDFVTSMQGERMMSSANLIGKTVAVPDGPVILSGGNPVNGVVNLPNGADGVKFDVYNSKGSLVRSQIMGAQTVGDMTWTWDGKDDAGNTAADGTYSFKATAVSQGKTTNPSVSTMAYVTSVSQDSTQSILLQVQGGKTVKLADVKSIGY